MVRDTLLSANCARNTYDSTSIECTSEAIVSHLWKFGLTIIALAFGQTASAQGNADWTTPITPFRLAQGLYYVGSKDLASYLVVTPRGNILINSSLESSPALIRKSVEELGFKYSDIKILLISHAHWDHDAGSARVVKETGAKYMVMDGDVPVVESGGTLDFAYGNSPYPKAKVDRVLHDGDAVKLGDAVLVAHKTAGHTRGCTTWTLKVKQDGKTLNAVIVGSWNVNPGFRLVEKPQQPASYPGIADDYRKTFALLKKLPCDIFLGAHGAYFNMIDKLARVGQAGDSVWIDPQGYKDAVAERENAFEAELRKQQEG
jgi:metallo-beta-lactamase class B